MDVKTPKFTRALNEILENLKPHSRKCQECGKDFEIMAEDIEFYKKLQVPPPTLCWQCRLQRKLGNRLSFLPIFYKKTCSAPGHQEKVIAYYADKNPVKVYDDQYYLSDKWEATEFGVDFDMDKSFFKQYYEFSLTVPHQTLFKDPKSINSDYVISGAEAKDCYYVSAPIFSEKIYYGLYPLRTKECIDIVEIKESELVFDSVLVDNCYKVISNVNSSHCLDSSFLFDCKNCQNCFMSSNLRNKSYVFRNQQLTKEEYEQKIKEINFGSRKIYQELKKEFNKLIRSAIKKNLEIVKSENCTKGDNIRNSKNCFNAYDTVETENVRYDFTIFKNTDTMDIFGALNSSLIYESTGLGDVVNSFFVTMCRNSVGLEYCSECNNCENCFACFGLKNKKYHIFNKAYREEDYWQKVDELKTKMLERGEYGEFFPLKDSPFPYQDSNAQIEFPLTEEEIKKKGWHWQDEVKSEIDLTKIKTIKGEEVPDDIKDVNDNILKTPIICERTNKPFKITPYELEFYRKMNVPLPIIHPLERVKDLFKYRRPYRLYQTKCAKCQKEIETVYNPKETENIYCERCYNRSL